ncbi:MAG: Ohr family peroxiredoxin [Actinophytocola sp.]|uniref:Ohr family peroxiredoxin n=1 Tax=Actinophytocola sp. TaxID=1872138 RepID=UPI00132BB89D|nr:Ohr family peroxiredoxin [Actinophytocola sp.]MPZ82498.1 Ohr family peroxiredoxin [Actinophytocola sp.]
MSDDGRALTSRLYTASVSARGGRNGTVTSEDGQLSLTLAKPGSRQGTNPEQLLAAGWSACFQSTLVAVARREELPLADSMVTVAVALGRTADDKWGLSAEISVQATGVDDTQLGHLIETAHQDCPFSRMATNGVDVRITATNTSGATT